jgi:hypothetical protein
MPHIAFDKGGEADVLALAGERITLRSTIASPPGSPLTGTLHASVNAHTPIRIKVHGCRREGDGFRIEGRIIDLSRDLRATLAGLLPP